MSESKELTDPYLKALYQPLDPVFKAVKPFKVHDVAFESRRLGLVAKYSFQTGGIDTTYFKLVEHNLNLNVSTRLRVDGAAWVFNAGLLEVTVWIREVKE